MTNTAKITVFVPITEAQTEYAASLDSLAAQNYENMQIVIIDTTGEEMVRQKVAEIAAPQLNIEYHVHRRGNFADAFRHIIRYDCSDTDFITWLLPGDTLASEDKFATVLDTYWPKLPVPDVGMQTSHVMVNNAEANAKVLVYGAQSCASPTVYSHDDMSAALLRGDFSPAWSLSALLVTENCWAKAKQEGFNLPQTENDVYSLWQILLKHGRVAYFPQVLAKVRKYQPTVAEAAVVTLHQADAIRANWPTEEDRERYGYKLQVALWVERASAVLKRAVAENVYAPELSRLNTRLIECSAGLAGDLRPRKCAVCGHEFLYFMGFNMSIIANNNVTWGRREMESLINYACPNCKLPDRYRAYALWMSRELSDRQDKDFRILDFAPEGQMSRFIRQNWPLADYKTADIARPGVDYQLDIMDMSQLADASFDFFLCSHVLEHVNDDLQAMRELKRILKPGGCGICVVPMDLDQEEIDEDPSCYDPAECMRRFGWPDHIRKYSREGYIARLQSVGFTVGIYGQDYFGAEAMYQNGLDESATVYVITKEI